MIDEYDKITAEHYSSYRPPLHDIILKKCISENESYTYGLDIGCGTGQSSIALAKFCDNVIAIDPSSSMLKKAIEHSNIEYQNYDGKALKFENDSFDSIAFAGSLYYGKSQKLLDEIMRVSKPSSSILIYDFEFLSEPLLKKLDFVSAQQSDYNHDEDFSGLQNNSLELVSRGKEKIDIPIKTADLSHLLLSIKEQHYFFKDRFDPDNPHQALTEKLMEIFDSGELQTAFHIFYKHYKVN